MSLDARPDSLNSVCNRRDCLSLVADTRSVRVREVGTQCDHLQKLKFSPVTPYAFTEHGAIMAATILNSPRAVAMSVFIVRAFVGLRRAISENRQLANKVAQVERRLADHDKQILVLARAVKQLTGPKPVPERRRIGFHPDEP